MSMLEKLPSYYRKSSVMQNLMHSFDEEMKRLENETHLSENQFFVLLSDRDIDRHERDVGLHPEPTADLETRRSRILSRLRGTGTVTKTMMKNVSMSFINGEIEITEYPSRYMFSVTFTSKQGIPYNLSDIKAMIEEIKPAHLAVEYIFTYRLWQDVLSLTDWSDTRTYTWEGLLTFTPSERINIIDGKAYFCPDENGNGYVVWNNNRAYARRKE